MMRKLTREEVAQHWLYKVSWNLSIFGGEAGLPCQKLAKQMLRELDAAKPKRKEKRP